MSVDQIDRSELQKLIQTKGAEVALSKENEEPYILAFGNSIDDYKELMQTNYFLRLKDKYEAYSMESVGSDIDELERRNAISERVAKAYREMFHIVKEDTSDETFIIGDKNVPKD